MNTKIIEIYPVQLGESSVSLICFRHQGDQTAAPLKAAVSQRMLSAGPVPAGR